MIVITLTDCPPALRGDLTNWLFEVNTGVYVGKTSARVRDELWKRVCQNIKKGRATMAFSVSNEQGIDYRVHNSHWQPIDFDGLKLMMRPYPNVSFGEKQPELRPGFSNAAKKQMASRSKKKRRNTPSKYIVLDIETTGLVVSEDEIIEVAALRVEHGEVVDTFQSLIRTDKPIPSEVIKLTGITNEILHSEGREPRDVISELISYVSDLPIIAHNSSFDMEFLRKACKKLNLPLLINSCIDTSSLAHRRIHDVSDFKLSTLAEYFGIDAKVAHRSEPDCITTKLLYDKLIKIE